MHFQVPHFSHLDLSNMYEFQPALTDGGICHVYDGNTLDATYFPQDRVFNFHKYFDPRVGAIKPQNITGTGQLYRKVFWLDVAER